MKRVLILLLLIITVILLPLFAACEETSPTSPSATSAATATPAPPAKANWWDDFGEPQYGGTITFREGRNLQYVFDPWNPWVCCWYNFDMLFGHDWTLDRQVWDYQTEFVPEDYLKPLIAESWEWQDAQTMVIHIREGVHWQDKEPANGREFTAYDVQFHFDRMLGTGNGFTEPNPNYMGYTGPFERVIAEDTYTVVVKFRQPSVFSNSQAIFEGFLQIFELPELVESGGINDWKNYTGTGPYILEDYVPNTSMNFGKNPDYWRYDERYPENRLPYADYIKIIYIPDPSTAISALRTGKIDMLKDLDWRQAQNLAETSPELQQQQVPGTNLALYMRCDQEPFTDVNVRKALQMSLPLDIIAEKHYGGMVEGQPNGLIYQGYTGWCFPYEEWPQDIKDGHSYDVEGAKQLLAGAGYPDGFDTTLVACTTDDTALLEIVKAYFMDINVDMEIELLDMATAMEYLAAGKHDQMCTAYAACPHSLNTSLGMFESTNIRNYSHVSDPAYDKLFANLQNSGSTEEAQQWSQEMDRYFLENYWRVDVFPKASVIAWQPYLKGYTGEQLLLSSNFYWARLWVDEE